MLYEYQSIKYNIYDITMYHTDNSNVGVCESLRAYIKKQKLMGATKKERTTMKFTSRGAFKTDQTFIFNFVSKWKMFGRWNGRDMRPI